MRATPHLTLAAFVTTLGLLAGPVPVAAAPAASAPESSAVAVQAKVTAGSSLRFATFNIRSARLDRGTSRSWLRRASSVAREIQSRRPDVVAIQELGPGRADGVRGQLNGRTRQTQSLLNNLRAIGAGEYRLHRVTAYIKPGRSHSTQGARILYNSRRVKLVSNCPERTGKKNYNPACGMDVTWRAGANSARSAAYAQFEDRRTGKRFWVISVHLEPKHGPGISGERRMDALRRSQVRKVYQRVASLANGKPILFGGDINSWKSKRGSHAPFNFMRSVGFTDATSVGSRIGSSFPTVNHWRRTLTRNRAGRQVALDVVMGKRVRFSRYENVMKVTDSRRPSDHNMVVADLTFS